jgi:predicted P-loop ATPase
MARRNRRHPVREFLDDLAWDGTPRLDRWLSTYMGAKETEYTRAVGALVLVAAVRRVRKPGCKFDEMVVLEGPQGGFKSTALKVLAILEDWFSDDLPLNAKPQQFIEQTVGKWIVEAGELKGMRKGDVDSLKSCLSRQRDRSRMAFGHLPLERARQFVIIGTTNSDRYLKDNTGNRRFWPVRVGEVKIDDLRRDREQLWAEAAAREAAGASIRLDPDLYGAASEEQARRRVEDPFVETLGAMLNGAEGKLRSIDAWAIVGVPEGQRTQDHNQRLGDAMRELGWERTKLRFDGVVEHCYAKGDARARWRRVEVLLDDRGRATGVRDGSATDETLGGGERPAGEGER